MRMTKLSSTAIATLVTLGVLTPTAAWAVPTALDTTGKVTVEEGGNEPIPPGVTDPENPDVILPTVDPDPGETLNPDLGPLMIERASKLDFGTIKTSANEVTTYALPTSFGGGTVKRGNYVEWRDIRAGGTYGYTLTAELAQQFTGATSATTLTGAAIDFTNGFLVQPADNTNPVPSTVAPSFQLTAGGGASTVVNASQAQKEGKGRYLMAFGKEEDGTDAQSVKLTVPATTAANMSVDTYTAKVTWKVNAAPTAP